MVAPDFDPFEALAASFSAVTAIHNVVLVDVQPSESGFERLVVEHNGRRRDLAGGGRWSAEWSRRDVGRCGHLVPARNQAAASTDLPVGACYFRPYVDPTLRRVPEFDDSKGNVGWRCDAQAGGFLAPAHIVPGADGRFVPDHTEQVTVRVPPEFVRECRQVQRTPQELLEGFIADAAGIQNEINRPRADRFGSNGSDEREMAEAWIRRAYGMDAVDPDKLEMQRYEAEQRESEREDFGGLLDDFVDSGGKPDELFRAVQALVEQQRSKNEG